MDKLRFGIIGCGSMATHHMNYLSEIPRVSVAAVCDIDDDALKRAVDKTGGQGFEDGHALIDSGEVDAILIATPHYFHPVYAMHAFEKGLHVLTEKPVAVTARAAQEVNEAHQQHKGLVYGAMFQQRTNPGWRTIKRLIDNGRIGELLRVNWTITNWFRTQAYYDSGGWRATWEGEGGGVLINQCPHNLDLFQWWVGMPSKVTAKVGLGKYHHIEVEDEVAAILEFDNGAIGTFVTSTGEAPGINRLEIVGENGTLISDDKGIRFRENHTPVGEFRKTSPERFGTPPTDDSEISPGGKGGAHRIITENFVAAVLDGTELIASAEEGIHGLELGNAMLMSGLTGKTVPIPTDRDAFDEMMKDLAKNSTFKKAEVKDSGPVAMGSSF